MKNLRQMIRTDWRWFAKDKRFMVTNVMPWQDYDTKALLGTKVETVITVDNTPYQAGPDGTVQTNLFEKITFKVAKNEVKVEVGDFVEPVNAVATIYGDYQNQLSVKADDVVVVDHKVSGVKK